MHQDNRVRNPHDPDADLTQKELEEKRAARDSGIIQLIQSQCVHLRRDFISKSKTQRCLDCGKILYGRG